MTTWTTLGMPVVSGQAAEVQEETECASEFAKKAVAVAASEVVVEVGVCAWKVEEENTEEEEREKGSERGPGLMADLKERGGKGAGEGASPGGDHLSGRKRGGDGGAHAAIRSK